MPSYTGIGFRTPYLIGRFTMRIRWRRLLTNPTTAIESREGGVTRLRVDGLVCDSVCAVRAEQALSAMPGVRRVSIDYDAGIATIEGEAHEAAAYERAVAGAVAGKPLRRAIEFFAHLVARRVAQPPPAAKGGSQR